MVFYDNTLNHETGSAAAYDMASTGFDLGNGGYGIVVDDNTVNNCTYGIRAYAAENDDYYTSGVGWDTFNFLEIMNNYLTVPEAADTEPVGIYFYTAAENSRPDLGFVGINIENNRIINGGVSYSLPGNTPFADAVGIGLPGFQEVNGAFSFNIEPPTLGLSQA